MFRKVLVGVFLVGVVGAVVAGIVALATPSECALAQQEGKRTAVEQGNGYRGGREEEGYRRNDNSSRFDREPGTAGNGRGRQTANADPGSDTAGYGRGQNRNTGQPQRVEQPSEHDAWQTVEGAVIETVELVVETIDGDTVQVGLGPSHYRESQGFIVNVGDRVRVSGYWEGDEFKAAEVENLSTGIEIVLRDASGRPMWAGQGRRSG
jgi:hypothetical protein